MRDSIVIILGRCKVNVKIKYAQILIEKNTFHSAAASPYQPDRDLADTEGYHNERRETTKCFFSLQRAVVENPVLRQQLARSR